MPLFKLVGSGETWIPMRRIHEAVAAAGCLTTVLLVDVPPMGKSTGGTALIEVEGTLATVVATLEAARG